MPGPDSGREPSRPLMWRSVQVVLTDQRGAPLAVTVTAAHHHDVTVGLQTLDAIILKRPRGMVTTPQQLCADKGYDAATFRGAVRRRGYTPHMQQRGDVLPRRRCH